MKTKKIIFDPKNYKKTPMTTVVYGDNDQKIRKTKTVTKSNGKVKKVEYGPVDHYANQTKTKTVTKNGKTRTTYSK